MKTALVRLLCVAALFSTSFLLFNPLSSLVDFSYLALGSTSTTIASSRSPVHGGKQLFSNVARLGFAAGCDRPALKTDEPKSDSIIAFGTRSSRTLSFSNVTSKAKVVEGPNASKSNDAWKRGKKPNRILMSASGGRRYRI